MDPAAALRTVSAAHSCARGAVARFVLGGRIPLTSTTLSTLAWLAPLHLGHADVETTKILVLAAEPRALARSTVLGSSERRVVFRPPLLVLAHASTIERFLESKVARVLVDDVDPDRAGYLASLVRAVRSPARVLAHRGTIGSLPRCLVAAHLALFPDLPLRDVAARPCIAFAEALDRAAEVEPLTLLLALEPTPGFPPALRDHERSLARELASRLAALLTVARVVLTCPGIADDEAPVLRLEPLVLTLDAAAAEADVCAQLEDPTLPRPQRITALIGMAAFAAGRDLHADSITHGVEACRLARGDVQREAIALYALGTSLYRLGNHEQAVATLSLATMAAVDAKQFSVAAHALVTMAGSHLAAGVHPVALRCLDAGVACARASGSVAIELFARMWRGEALAASGDDEAAVRELREAHELAERLAGSSPQLAPQTAEIHARLGALLASRGLPSHARAHSERGRELGCRHALAKLP